MMRAPPFFNPISARYQRRNIHEKHANKTVRICSWLYRAAKWNQEQGNYETATLLLGQMTDFVEA